MNWQISAHSTGHLSCSSSRVDQKSWILQKSPPTVRPPACLTIIYYHTQFLAASENATSSVTKRCWPKHKSLTLRFQLVDSLTMAESPAWPMGEEGINLLIIVFPCSSFYLWSHPSWWHITGITMSGKATSSTRLTKLKKRSYWPAFPCLTASLDICSRA